MTLAFFLWRMMSNMHTAVRHAHSLGRRFFTSCKGFVFCISTLHAVYLRTKIRCLTWLILTCPLNPRNFRWIRSMVRCFFFTGSPGALRWSSASSHWETASNGAWILTAARVSSFPWTAVRFGCMRHSRCKVHISTRAWGISRAWPTEFEGYARLAARPWHVRFFFRAYRQLHRFHDLCQVGWTPKSHNLMPWLGSQRGPVTGAAKQAFFSAGSASFCMGERTTVLSCGFYRCSFCISINSWAKQHGRSAVWRQQAKV